MQDSRIRLYTSDPDTGIARKGSDTYTEIDLATIDDEHLTWPPLLMTPTALCEERTADAILTGSMDHAAGLGERLPGAGLRRYRPRPRHRGRRPDEGYY